MYIYIYNADNYDDYDNDKKNQQCYNLLMILDSAICININNQIIIKKDWQCKGGRVRLTPYQSEDPSPTLPAYRGKEDKGKIVEDKKGESN